ncbi:MAG: hypothetical protein IPG74_07120 [Flavobacteriales bacterium]|nr:hypothetical protein [Flavobacteriales bacterium]
MSLVNNAKHALSKLKHRVLNTPNAWRQRSNFFLIYTLGKVGSSTLYATLKKKLPGVPVHHVHYLSEKFLGDLLPKSDVYFRKHIGLGRRILADLDKHKDKRIKIITLVREPVARDVSALFQTWRGRFGDVPFDSKSNTELIAHLKERKFQHTLTWFDEEFKEWTGVDIYSLPFDMHQGYSIHHTERFDILVVKLEQLNECFASAMHEFIGLDLSRLELANIGEEKLSREKYKSLAAENPFHARRTGPRLRLQYMRHFFSDEEIATARERWSSDQ